MHQDKLALLKLQYTIEFHTQHFYILYKIERKFIAKQEID